MSLKDRDAMMEKDVWMRATAAELDADISRGTWCQLRQNKRLQMRTKIRRGVLRRRAIHCARACGHVEA